MSVLNCDELGVAVGGMWLRRATSAIRGAEIDTRRDVAGKAFFAMRGSQADGHDFLGLAAEGKCAAVVVEREVDVPPGPGVLLVQDCRRALLAAGRAWRASTNARVIAITGSAGKTTTKELTGAVLRSVLGDDAVHASPGSFNNDLGVPLTFLGAGNARVVVVEVGANARGEIAPLADLISPHVAVLTAIGPAHLEGFGTVRNILHEKGQLLSAVEAVGAVIAPEDIDLASVPLRAPLQTVGVPGAASGRHNEINVELAVAAAAATLQSMAVEFDMADLRAAAAFCDPLPGRGTVCHIAGIEIVDDAYNANPLSMAASLAAFAAAETGDHRRVVILGDMLELGPAAADAHAALADDLRRYAFDLVMLVGANMRHAASGADVHEAVASDAAMHRLADHLKPGDRVLLKGSRGLELERIMEALARQRTQVGSD